MGPIKKSRYWNTAGYLAKGIQFGYNQIKKHYEQKNQRTNLTKAIRDAAPLTSQHDYTSQYRKRSRPRGRKAARRRRRAKRFYRSVKKVENSMLGSRIHFRSYNGTASFAGAAGTVWGVMNLVLAQTGSRELTIKNIRDSMLADNISLRKTTRLFIQTCVLDISLTSKSTNTAPIDLDVYVIVCRKNIPQNGLGAGIENFASSETGLPNTNVGYIPVTDAGVAKARSATTVTTSQIGWTPWLSPNFCSYFTVRSKKKILLTPGSSTHLQLKKNLYKMISLEDCDKYDCKSGWTFGYLFQANSVYNGASAPGSIDFNFEQYYNVKQLRDSEDTVVSL